MVTTAADGVGLEAAVIVTMLDAVEYVVAEQDDVDEQEHELDEVYDDELQNADEQNWCVFSLF